MRIFFGVLVSVALSIALSACASDAEVSGPSPSSVAEESAPPNEAEASSEVPSIDVTKMPEDVIQHNHFEELAEGQKAEILEMKNMSLADFRLLPHEQQLKFAYFVYDNNIDILKYRLDQTGQSDVYTGANFETAAGMRNHEDMKYLLLASLKTRSLEAGVAIDTETALKASAYLNPDGNINRQLNADNQIRSWNLNTSSSELVETTIVDSATLRNGDIVSNEFGPVSQSSIQNTYRAIDVPLINGETRKDGVMVLSVTESDVRYIADIHNQ